MKHDDSIARDHHARARVLVSFWVGALFALGLGISGMTLPSKVIGFLDITGDWDPSLAFVMGGAVIVYALAYRFVLEMPRPRLSPRFLIPTRRDITWRLLAGSALFGVGWGIGGFCPGPALVSTGAGASGTSGILVFLGAMIGGVYLYKVFDLALERLKHRGRDEEPSEPELRVGADASLGPRSGYPA